MATGREWTTWGISVEGRPEVVPALKHRLEPFLDLAMARIAVLAARLDGATDLDVLTALNGAACGRVAALSNVPVR